MSDTPRGNRHTGVYYTHRLPTTPVTREQLTLAREEAEALGISVAELTRRRLFGEEQPAPPPAPRAHDPRGRLP